MKSKLSEIEIMSYNAEKQPLRVKVLGASVSEEFHSEVLVFCKDRNWVLSRFIEKAIKREMMWIEEDERIEREEED